jgi:UPF0271 protein
VAAQTGALIALAALAGVAVRYVKPHGALANVASEDRVIAESIARAVAAVDGRLAILAISGTMLEQVARDRGMLVFSEIFADRGYTPAGNLVPRGQPGAMIEDADEAAERLLRFLDTGEMPTVGGGTARWRRTPCASMATARTRSPWRGGSARRSRRAGSGSRPFCHADPAAR